MLDLRVGQFLGLLQLVLHRRESFLVGRVVLLGSVIEAGLLVIHRQVFLDILDQRQNDGRSAFVLIFTAFLHDVLAGDVPFLQFVGLKILSNGQAQLAGSEGIEVGQPLR